MAGKVCAFLHPNQTKRHFERASEAQIADLNNQAAINVQEITQQKDTSLAQIEALFLQGLQEIEDSYKAEYEPAMAEFLKDKGEHEELLASLSFFMIYGKAIINATEQQHQLASLASNYTGAVAEETARFSHFIAEHDAKLQALNLYKTEEVCALNAFMDAQRQLVAEQYTLDINSVAVALKGLRDEANSRLNTQLKVLKEQRKSVALNALVLVGAAVAVYAAPALIAAASAGKVAAGAIQISAVSTGMSAANNLLNGNSTVGVTFTASIPNYNPKPYVSLNTSPYLPKQNSASDNFKSQGELPANYSNCYNNYAAQPMATITYANDERSSKANTNTRIEVPPAPPVIPKSEGIKWPMVMRAVTNDNSPEVLNWQQNNRNRFPRAAAFFDSIAQSKAQRTVDAFADEFAGRPVRFISEEASRLKQGTETQTQQYVVQTLDSASKAKDFALEDAERFVKGQVTETGLFFEKIGNFIDDDIERFWNGEETVIGTALEQDFKALAAMSSEELAAHLGHEAGDAFLLYIGGGGFKAAGSALVKAADTAAVVGRYVPNKLPGNLNAWQKFKSTQTRSTGARELTVSDISRAEELAETAYRHIRSNPEDIKVIAQNTGLNEFRIQRIKEHLFFKEHQLRYSMGRFDADPLIVESWKRLESGTFTNNDLHLLNHELFESKFEGIFKTDYLTSHNAANRAGYVSPVEGLNAEQISEIYNGFLHRFR